MKLLTAAVATTALLATPALADNSRYGETRINQLPAQGRTNHALWVGSWWAYTRNGIAYRHKTSGFPECSGVSAQTSPADLVDEGKAFCLSAAEKIDFLAGRLDQIEWDKISEYQTKAQSELGPLQTRIRDLVRVLNRWIADNPGENWRETDDGKEYLEKTEELEQKKAELPQITIDTATEFEHIEHGKGVPGVEGWWGHCNAWAAASIMEDEPKVRAAVEHDGRSVEITAGEAKALFTEGWMEHQSDFVGSRSNERENKMDDVAYADVTAAGFHISFADRLGRRNQAFVMDRFTGSEVWNQSVRSYKFETSPLYENDEAETVEVFETSYDWQGNGKRESLGEREVYPVHVTAYIHWMTDGLPHEEMTVDNILADAWPTGHSELRNLWGRQVEMRELTYTLYLDKPMSDPAARIIGDGVWDESLHGDNHAWPDFIWQPQAQTPSRRDYENPHLRWEDLVVGLIAPATAGGNDNGGGDNGGGDNGGDAGSGSFSANDTPIAIPDNDRNGITSTLNVDRGGRLTAATLTIDLTHTYRGDLLVTLIKDGQSVVLHNRAGGSRDDLKQTFDLPQLVGKAAMGEYKLQVVDLARADEGTLNSWSIDLEWSGADPVDPDPEPSTPHEYASGDTPIAIPDDDEAGIKSTINVADSGVVETCSIHVQITHTYIGDLRITLQKGDQSHVLHNNEGGSADDIDQTWEVAALAGQSLAGAWVLKVSDHAGRDVGDLVSWTINASAR